jgi:hypothetical protein
MTKNFCLPLAWLTLLAAGSIGCDQSMPREGAESQIPSDDAEQGMTKEVVKLSVLSDGTLLVDGEACSLDQLSERLERVEAGNSAVWYYRENAGDPEPPAIAFQALDVVMRRRIPISLSSKPDFSDVIDDKGISRPRNSYD